jgi:hypothetical protein
MVWADQNPESMRMVSSPDAPARRTRPRDFVDEPCGAAGGVGPASALAGVQHLAAISTAGKQRVVAEGVGVAVGGALLVVAVDLADRGVKVDGHRPIARTRPSRPRSRKDCLGEPVELADMPEGEGA